MTDSFIVLPKNLQSKKRRLEKEKEKIESQIEEVEREIIRKRAACKHTPVPNTENNYACKCGYMMDSWL